MDRDELEELHYITPIDNVVSIVKRGILSHARAARLRHRSIADQQVQTQRADVVVPGGRRLHEYANLYICARNPMLYTRSEQHREICVLRIRPTVLDLPGVIVTDGNAASDWARFAPAPEGLRIVDRERTFAEFWTDPHRIEYFRRKSAKCAEVLVPDQVPPEHVFGAYVSGEQALATFNTLRTRLVATINRHLFFR